MCVRGNGGGWGRGETDLIWLMLGVRARRRASRAMGLHASKREAPKARYISTLSLLSLDTTGQRVGWHGSAWGHILDFLEDIRNGDDNP